ncbi:MAG: benzoyl-CoA 2,3-epoxidase subunit BoxB, partial [Planctomycetota bacterium]
NAGFRFSPAGELIDEATWTHNHTEWLPTQTDRDYVQSCMVKVTEPNKFANYIAPPQNGVNDKPIDFQYVQFH